MRILIFGLLVLLSACARRGLQDGSQFLRERSPMPMKPSKIIVIDPGHGGKDDGCNPKALAQEKELTLETAKLVQRHLKQLGYKVVMTRSSDIFIPLDERTAIANEFNCDLFLSVHFNSAKNAKAQGIEVYYCDQASNRSKLSKSLAKSVLDRIVTSTEAKSRGVKTADFRVIRETSMPAVLVEAGFLSNSEERKRCQDPIYQNAIAWGIARGIDEYLKK